MNIKEIQCVVNNEIQKETASTGQSELYLTPQQLCDRWCIKMKTLEKWRLEGKPPMYMKMQASLRAIIRYPLHGTNGVLDVEAKWLRSSTSDSGATNDREAK